MASIDDYHPEDYDGTPRPDVAEDETLRVIRCRCQSEVLVDVETERIGLHFSPKDDELLCPMSGTLTDDGWRRLLADICEDENLTITYRRGDDHVPPRRSCAHCVWR